MVKLIATLLGAAFTGHVQAKWDLVFQGLIDLNERMGNDRNLLNDAGVRYLNRYGCWCYFDDEIGNGKGDPVDLVDAECKSLHGCYECIILDILDEGGFVPIAALSGTFPAYTVPDPSDGDCACAITSLTNVAFDPADCSGASDPNCASIPGCRAGGATGALGTACSILNDGHKQSNMAAHFYRDSHEADCEPWTVPYIPVTASNDLANLGVFIACEKFNEPNEFAGATCTARNNLRGANEPILGFSLPGDTVDGTGCKNPFLAPGLGKCATRACSCETQFTEEILLLFVTESSNVDEFSHTNGFHPKYGCELSEYGTHDPRKECCGQYPDRFPFKLLPDPLDDSRNLRECCGGSTYPFKTFKCCNGASAGNELVGEIVPKSSSLCASP